MRAFSACLVIAAIGCARKPALYPTELALPCQWAPVDGNVPMKPSEGRVVGAVCDRYSGKPIAGNLVAVPLAGGREVDVTSDERGGFVLDVPPGSYTLLFNNEFVQARRPVVVREGQTTIVIETFSADDFPGPNVYLARNAAR